MPYSKQRWGYYDESKTEEQNIQAGNVFTPEKLNHIEDGIKLVEEETNRQLAQNMTQKEFDSWVATLLDGGPSIFMETLIALEEAYPNGSSGVALVRETDPARIYVWDGKKWSDFGEYQGVEVKDKTITTSKLAEKAVTSNKTAYLSDEIAEDSIVNIMPEKLSAIGDFYDPSNGVLANNENTQNFKNTGKIYLTEKGEIETYGNNSLVFFDASGNFISASKHGSDEAIAVKRRIVPPERAIYFIANIPKPYLWDEDGKEFPNLAATLKFIPEKSKMATLRITKDNFEKIKDPSFNPLNMFENITLSVAGKAIDVNTGSIVDNSERKHSNWVEIKPVEYRSLGVAHILFKRADGTFIPNFYNYNNDKDLAMWQSWVPPVGAKYMAFNLVTYYFERAEMFQMETTDRANHVSDLSVDKKLDSLDIFKGKTILDLGDSITAGNGYPSDVSSVVAKDLKANVINMGFGGTRASTHPNENYNNFSFHKIVDSLISKDFSLQEASSKITGIGMPSYYAKKVETLKTLNLNYIDILKIGYGTNDWNGVALLDNPEKPMDTNTYIGALRYSITKLLQSYPHLKIVLTTPIYRFKEDGSMDSDDWVAGDKKLTDFVDALFSLGKELKLPVIDCYYNLGINKYNKLQYFSSVDGTHPNYKGRELLGHKHANGIKNAY